MQHFFSEKKEKGSRDTARILYIEVKFSAIIALVKLVKEYFYFLDKGVYRRKFDFNIFSQHHGFLFFFSSSYYRTLDAKIFEFSLVQGQRRNALRN